MFGRKLKTHLHCLQPHLYEIVEDSQDRQKKGHDSCAKQHEFQVDELVYAKSYASGYLGYLEKLLINLKLSSIECEVEWEEIRKHADQQNN